jgi:hypothetical protein
MKDRLMQIKWDVVILDEAHRLKQMASDGQPGWGEVVRDLVGPPTLPLDSPETPGIVFGEANKETLSNLSNPPCALDAQKEPPVSQNQQELIDLGKLVADIGGALNRVAALLSRIGTASAVEETAKATVKIDLQAPCTTLGAGAIAAISAPAEKPVEKVQPQEQALAKPLPEAKAETKPEVIAEKEDRAPGEVAPLTFAEFSAFLPKFLGDPVGDKASYETRRASVYRECSAAAGVTEKILPAKLTDAQRGLVALRLGFTK